MKNAIFVLAWFIYKKQCQNTGCGYINANFLCDEGFACLNNDLDNEYTMTIKCSDAYGSDDTETFTLKVTENQPPVFTNTPSKFLYIYLFWKTPLSFYTKTIILLLINSTRFC
jgi:hypothetical protein